MNKQAEFSCIINVSILVNLAHYLCGHLASSSNHNRDGWLVYFLPGRNLLLDLTLALPTPAPSNSLALSSSSGNGSSGRAVRRTNFCFTSCAIRLSLQEEKCVTKLLLEGLQKGQSEYLDPFFTARRRSSQVQVTL